MRKNSAGDPEEPNGFELNLIRNDPQKLEILRLRLSDLGWWMRVLCPSIAVRANREDHELGKFWQSRFRAVRLLDEAALLACAAYVWRKGDGTSHDVSFQWIFNVGRSHSPFFNRLPSQGDYLELLDWTARQVAPGKRGMTPPSTPPLFQRLSGKLPTATAWVELVQDFGKLFAVIAGHPQTIRATRSRISGFPHRMRPPRPRVVADF